jgi:hypothetical protein
MKNKQLIGLFIVVVAALLGTLAFVILPTIQVGHQPVASPEQVVREFYAWHLGYKGNVLTDKAYHQNSALTSGFIGHVDELLVSFENQGGYDPFLCAQDIPTKIEVDGVFSSPEWVYVLVRTNFPNHFFTVDLLQSDEVWKIGNITCAFDPFGTAKAFYTWYLGYVSANGSPINSKAYRTSGFLSERLIAEVDELALTDLPADPFLMAQDLPVRFGVDPGHEPDTAFVHLEFEGNTIAHLKVNMVSEIGAWKIDSVQLMP